MALTTNIPPQAYTRETLVKAIEWLQSQSPAVRERATSADLVVSHYLQARRRTAAFETDSPVSSEVFKSDLKHLAEDMKQFESPTSPHHNVPNRSPSFELPPELQVQPAPRHRPPVSEETPMVSAQVAYAPSPAPTPVPAAPKPASIGWPVDARSLAAAREIQQRLNLGSEVEALRLLVTLGAEHARALFP